MPPPPLLLQTTYAELLERCRTTAFQADFPDDGTFVAKTIKGKRYWYFQHSVEKGREQKYVGPETPELLKQIEHHKQVRDDERERRSLVSTLVRSFGLQPPIFEIGEIIEALAKAGVFRLRGVLVGTVAYQTYSAILGVRLPHAILQTDDIDIAQFRNVSVAVGDQTPPVFEVLKTVDKTFKPVPHIHEPNVTSYKAKGGIRVDFLTPNEGPDTDVPQHLPAFQTDAEPLRFLDFLIHEPEYAVVLHGAGALVLVPSPHRYAVHKLIVSRRRPAGAAKRDKDLEQAAALLRVLAQKNAYDLKATWLEASKRGKTWRSLLLEGLGQISASTRDTTLKAVDERRDVIPGIDLTFSNSPAHYDFERDVVTFAGDALGNRVRCAVSREALADYFEANNTSKEERLETFRRNRSAIEAMLRQKYLHWPIEEPEYVLLKTMDVPELRKQLPSQRSR